MNSWEALSTTSALNIAADVVMRTSQTSNMEPGRLNQRKCTIINTTIPGTYCTNTARKNKYDNQTARSCLLCDQHWLLTEENSLSVSGPEQPKQVQEIQHCSV